MVDQRGQPRDLRHQVGTVEGRRGLQAAVDGSPLPLPQGLLEEPAGGCRLDQARHASAGQAGDPQVCALWSGSDGASWLAGPCSSLGPSRGP